MKAEISQAQTPIFPSAASLLQELGESLDDPSYASQFFFLGGYHHFLADHETPKSVVRQLAYKVAEVTGYNYAYVPSIFLCIHAPRT